MAVVVQVPVGKTIYPAFSARPVLLEALVHHSTVSHADSSEIRRYLRPVDGAVIFTHIDPADRETGILNDYFFTTFFI